MTCKDWKWALYDKEGYKLQVFRIDLIKPAKKEKASAHKLFETKIVFMEGRTKKEAVEKVKQWYLDDEYKIFSIEKRI